ncbi:hypothetical protein NPIL_123361 [Nephila pilipes]|uniref:Uncharacterized protein n=1 Tax=Nephila pilipes TaxID=299642 RepID=A0A8X6K7G0_NEPPI|nr:hypothetical protein NPIL_123361 [Nephila pilipes]
MHTNSKELERLWIENKVSVEGSNCLLDEGVVPLKFLEICWNNKEIDFTLMYQHWLNTYGKAIELKCLYYRLPRELFDPVGFLNPVVIRMKFLLQDILPSALEKQQPIRYDSNIRNLVPILVPQDILTISTRLEEADLSIGEKHPVLLPAKSKFAELLVMRERIAVFYSGVSVTLTQIGRKF